MLHLSRGGLPKVGGKPFVYLLGDRPYCVPRPYDQLELGPTRARMSFAPQSSDQFSALGTDHLREVPDSSREAERPFLTNVSSRTSSNKPKLCSADTSRQRSLKRATRGAGLANSLAKPSKRGYRGKERRKGKRRRFQGLALMGGAGIEPATSCL